MPLASRCTLWRPDVHCDVQVPTKSFIPFPHLCSNKSEKGEVKKESEKGRHGCSDFDLQSRHIQMDGWMDTHTHTP